MQITLPTVFVRLIHVMYLGIHSFSYIVWYDGIEHFQIYY